MNEFEYIKKILSRLALENALENDAFVYQKNTVISKDLLVEGVHFLRNTEPCDIAKKAIRVNLSDIAAMGAKPYGYFLGLAINYTSVEWLRCFAKGLEEDNNYFSIKLLGGDTTKNAGASVISITMLGTIEDNIYLSRSGAKIGDSIYVSGTIGDASIGLQTYKVPSLCRFKNLRQQYKFPNPQIELGRRLCGTASSCIDISDGFIQDLGNICKSSAVGMEIYVEKIPFSPEVQEIILENKKYLELVLSGGDDYQLLFTAQNDIMEKNVTKIGKVVSGNDVKLFDEMNSEMQITSRGYIHF